MYDEWTWGSTCTNTQFGVTPSAATEPIPTLVNININCEVINSVMTIYMVEDLISDNWLFF